MKKFIENNMQQIKADEGKILAMYKDELYTSKHIYAPLNVDLSQWLEFDDKEEAKKYFNIEEGE